MKETAMNRVRILGALVAVPVLMSACGGGDADKAGGEGEAGSVVLTLANPDDGSFNLDEYAREVESLSDGSVRIEFRNNWRPGEVDTEQGTIEDVREGKVDLGSVGARAFDLVGVDSFQPLVAPFAIDSYALQGEVLSSPVAERMLNGVEEVDLVGVTLLPGELRKPLGVSRPLVTESDYRGATVGIRPSEIAARTFEALGATTNGYHFSDDVSSFDGIEVSLNSIPYDGTDRLARALTANVSLWPRVLTIIMNRDAYDGLSDDQRAALSDAGGAALDPSLEEIRNREQEALGILCTRGELAVRSASPAQLESLRTATAPVAQAVERDPDTRDAAQEIAAMRAEVEPEPAPACDEGESEPVAGESTPVDGLWQMETTREEAATVVQPADLIPENWGEFIFAFRDGRFALTTESEAACIWAYGSYSVDGHTVELRIEDGGGETPQDAANTPGEVFVYDWSRYRDQLELAPVEGEVSPEPFRVEPWRQLEGEVSVEPLSDRCPPPADALEP
jgi:TRAP-type C4-dicarboxylate transport system substrate-binding protein